MMASDVDYNEASDYLKKSNGHVKTAIFMALTDVSVENAHIYLEQNEGFLKNAIKQWKNDNNI